MCWTLDLLYTFSGRWSLRNNFSLILTKESDPNCLFSPLDLNWNLFNLLLFVSIQLFRFVVCDAFSVCLVNLRRIAFYCVFAFGFGIHFRATHSRRIKFLCDATENSKTEYNWNFYVFANVFAEFVSTSLKSRSMFGGVLQYFFSIWTEMKEIRMAKCSRQRRKSIITLSTACSMKSIGVVRFAYSIDASVTIEWNEWSEFWRIVFVIRHSTESAAGPIELRVT